MKKYFLGLIAILISAVNVYADNGFIGTFRGTENLVLSGCSDPGTVNRSVSYWEVTNTRSGDNSFIGKIETRAGFSTYKGTISENTAKGTVRGMNRRGVSWSGVFTSKIDEDEYTLTITGSIPSRGCRFRSNIHATRQ